MISRGIIVSKSVWTDETNSNNKITKYKIRIPLIHGQSGDSSAVSDSKLPEATFCPLPGSQNTELNVGDLVYAANVDFRYDDIVILGCVPAKQNNTNSGASLTRIKNLSSDVDAEINLGTNIKIGDEKNNVNFENLSALIGVDYNLNEHTWEPKNGGTGVALSSNADESGKKKVRDNFGIFTTKIIKSSDFQKLEDTRDFEKNTIYYIYED